MFQAVYRIHAAADPARRRCNKRASLAGTCRRSPVTVRKGLATMHAPSLLPGLSMLHPPPFRLLNQRFRCESETRSDAIVEVESPTRDRTDLFLQLFLIPRS